MFDGDDGDDDATTLTITTKAATVLAVTNATLPSAITSLIRPLVHKRMLQHLGIVVQRKWVTASVQL